jgi:hypothetical protein
MLYLQASPPDVWRQLRNVCKRNVGCMQQLLKEQERLTAQQSQTMTQQAQQLRGEWCCNKIRSALQGLSALLEWHACVLVFLSCAGTVFSCIPHIQLLATCCCRNACTCHDVCCSKKVCCPTV